MPTLNIMTESGTQPKVPEGRGFDPHRPYQIPADSAALTRSHTLNFLLSSLILRPSCAQLSRRGVLDEGTEECNGRSRNPTASQVVEFMQPQRGRFRRSKNTSFRRLTCREFATAKVAASLLSEKTAGRDTTGTFAARAADGRTSASTWQSCVEKQESADAGSAGEKPSRVPLRMPWYHGTTRRHPIFPALSAQTTQTRASKPPLATNTALSTGLKRQQ